MYDFRFKYRSHLTHDPYKCETTLRGLNRQLKADYYQEVQLALRFVSIDPLLSTLEKHAASH
jgi:hypothetical protein